MLFTKYTGPEYDFFLSKSLICVMVCLLDQRSGLGTDLLVRGRLLLEKQSSQMTFTSDLMELEIDRKYFALFISIFAERELNN